MEAACPRSRPEGRLPVRRRPSGIVGRSVVAISQIPTDSIGVAGPEGQRTNSCPAADAGVEPRGRQAGVEPAGRATRLPRRDGLERRCRFGEIGGRRSDG